jgi:hypothetical protein
MLATSSLLRLIPPTSLPSAPSSPLPSPSQSSAFAGAFILDGNGTVPLSLVPSGHNRCNNAHPASHSYTSYSYSLGPLFSRYPPFIPPSPPPHPPPPPPPPPPPLTTHISCARHITRHTSSSPSPVAAVTVHDLQVSCNHPLSSF